MKDTRSNARQHQEGERELADDECSDDSGCLSGTTINTISPSLSSNGSFHEHQQRRRLRSKQARSTDRLYRSISNSRIFSWLSRGRSVERVHRQSCGKADSSADIPGLLRGSKIGKKPSDNGSSRTSIAASTSSNSSNGSTNTNTGNKKKPQNILRRPVAYTYAKGLSGLPTQRVPRAAY
ncbi:uncharacterized protein LOC106640025 [Copidosoma floridanum]|uniref:uncharacterized protein LOC106640025 n=1 Tax=Copidosoma floridanum TaxID=29053 RepID=UPI0006C9C173|nr:uncharacterized protein LOC106640025 [Copidosoma floridanum]